MNCHTFAGHLGDGPVDVANLPAENGEGEGSEVLYADDANHGSVSVHDDGEGVVADEAQTEEFFVEAAGAVCVFGWDEGYKRAVGKHAVTSLVRRLSQLLPIGAVETRESWRNSGLHSGLE